MDKVETYEKLITLISQARGDRSLNQFALNCNVNTGDLSRITNGKFIKPPAPDFLKKISQHSQNDVTYESLMEAAGYLGNDINSEFGVPISDNNNHKLSSIDKKQYIEHMKNANEAFFMSDEFDDNHKKEFLDTMTEIFWQAKQ